MEPQTLPHRHDLLLLFEVNNGNPNGDPDAGNMPRLDPTTNLGLVSDVCLKRKVRNYIEHAKPAPQDHHRIFVSQGAVLNNTVDEEADACPEAKGKKEKDQEEAVLRCLCAKYYDIRAFGAVLSTGNKVFKGSAYGQVRGPVQFTFGRSFHAITPLEISITRCAVTNAADAAKERTMGAKHIVPYALYAAKAYASPVFADKTGFTTADYDLLIEALLHMFEQDRSAARGEMILRGLYDFEHAGSQHPNNQGQNAREARLGCYHAHKLFEGVQVQLDPAQSAPRSFADYRVNCSWTPENMPAGVELHLRHEGRTIARARGAGA
jgi:CRISPR-associated protein Csd2